MKLIDNFLLNFFIKKMVNQEQVDFIVNLFALSVFADKKINSLELKDVKKDIKEYLNTYYSMLNNNFKKILCNEMYYKTLSQLEKMKKNTDNWDLEKEKVFFK